VAAPSPSASSCSAEPSTRRTQQHVSGLSGRGLLLRHEKQGPEPPTWHHHRCQHRAARQNHQYTEPAQHVGLQRDATASRAGESAAMAQPRVAAHLQGQSATVTANTASTAQSVRAVMPPLQSPPPCFPLGISSGSIHCPVQAPHCQPVLSRCMACEPANLCGPLSQSVCVQTEHCV